MKMTRWKTNHDRTDMHLQEAVVLRGPSIVVHVGLLVFGSLVVMNAFVASETFSCKRFRACVHWEADVPGVCLV